MTGLILLAGSALAQSSMHMPEQVGHVHLSTTCSTTAAGDLDRGLSLYYSFWYDEARKSFSRAVALDPHCAMAYWGQAISEYQPVETLPEGQQLEAGQKYLVRAQSASEASPHERAYIGALGAIFDITSRPKASERAIAYSGLVGKLHTAYPDDSTATTFYALSLLSPELPDDPTLARNKEALSLLNGVLKREPDNPGVLHFILHASDSPALARFGVDAAHRYARIAPDSAHALHMPSHIFARLGLWQDDIQSNLASEKAAENNAEGMHTGAQHRLHAMEFLQYAYLQTGQYRKAKAIIEEAETVKPGDLEPGFESYYGWVEASLKVRFALDTGDWPAALKLSPPADAGLYVRRVDLWGQAVAAGHLQNAEAARQALSAYEATYSKTELADEESHQGAQLAETRAWTEFASGKAAQAEKLLSDAADHQDKVGKGEVELPAREMLADMYRLSGAPEAALRQYQLSLSTDPGRLMSLLHGKQTAQTLHRTADTVGFIGQITRNTLAADPNVKAKL